MKQAPNKKPVKFVRKTITLPKPVFEFAYEQTVALAAVELDTPNLSRYVKSLIVRDKMDHDKKSIAA